MKVLVAAAVLVFGLVGGLAYMRAQAAMTRTAAIAAQARAEISHGRGCARRALGIQLRFLRTCRSCHAWKARTSASSWPAR